MYSYRLLLQAIHPDRKNLLDFTRDAREFAITFMFTIEAHPLLVYMTALPFAKKCMPAVYSHFHDASLFPEVVGEIGSFDLSWEKFPFSGPRDLIWSMVYSPDGKRLASGSMDNTIQIWDTSTGREALPALQGHENTIVSIAFSPDGTRIASGSVDKTIRVWDVILGTLLVSLRGHEQAVLSVSFAVDSMRIVSGSSDTTVRIWDATSGAQVLPPLRGHENYVTSAEFSPDSTKIVSCSPDSTIRVWDATSGAEIFSPLPLDNKYGSATFSPDGHLIISKSMTNIISWDSSSGCRVVLGDKSDYRPPHSITVISGKYFTPCWIEDIETGKTISNLPYLLRRSCALSYGNELAVGTTTGNVFFMRFPPELFTCAETRTVDHPRSSAQAALPLDLDDQPLLVSYSCGQYYTYRRHICKPPM